MASFRSAPKRSVPRIASNGTGTSSGGGRLTTAGRPTAGSAGVAAAAITGEGCVCVSRVGAERDGSATGVSTTGGGPDAIAGGGAGLGATGGAAGTGAGLGATGVDAGRGVSTGGRGGVVLTVGACAPGVDVVGCGRGGPGAVAGERWGALDGSSSALC